MRVEKEFFTLIFYGVRAKSQGQNGGYCDFFQEFLILNF